MADKPKAPESSPEAATEPAKKSLPIKTLAIVAVLMAAEAAAVVFAMGLLGPRSSHAETDAHALVDDDSEDTVEIEVASEKYQNLSTGRVWVWDLSIFLQVKNKNAETVQAVLEQRKAEIGEGVGQIVSRAQHAQLKEPERQTLIRQISAFLERIRGMTDADGKPLVERVMIPKCRGFPSDF
jgi:flagellar basal body-associated protein FliL